MDPFIRLLLAFSVLAIFSLPSAFSQSLTNDHCMGCHEDSSLSKPGPQKGAPPMSLFVDSKLFKESVHKDMNCTDCHGDVTGKHPDNKVKLEKVNCAGCHENSKTTYDKSIHGSLKIPGAAQCADCHGHHDIAPRNSPNSKLHFTQLANTCGKCHVNQTAAYNESIHGASVAKGNREAPTCSNCHSEHDIQSLKGQTSIEISQELCGKCHGSKQLNTKFNMPQDRMTTFFDSYHGLASKSGSMVAANCGSCHDNHHVLPSTDKRSSIHPDNLVNTCSKCHSNATALFVRGKIHLDIMKITPEDDKGTKINFIVRKIYLFLIWMTIGVMLLHNGLIFYRKLLIHKAKKDRSISRFSTSQRVQHVFLVVSFFVLAITGFALKYPDTFASWLTFHDEEIRRIVHRIAAVVMVVVSIWHILYLFITGEGRKLLVDLLPNWNDLNSVKQNLRYMMGTEKREAHSTTSFGYAEKIEYWALIWGTIVMTVTGFVMWYKISATHFFPRWIVDIATTIHYYEAILACVAIVIWHFYHIIFDPDVYPLNFAFMDGKVTPGHGHDDHSEHHTETKK